MCVLKKKKKTKGSAQVQDHLKKNLLASFLTAMMAIYFMSFNSVQEKTYYLGFYYCYLFNALYDLM